MIGRFDCAALLSTVAGRHELLAGGQPFGIQVGMCGGEASADNQIDFGNLSKSGAVNRAPTTPLGYETDADGLNEWTLDRKIFFSNHGELCNVSLCEVQFLPNLKRGTRYSLLTEDEKPPEGVSLSRAAAVEFRVRMHVDTPSAYLGKWMLLCFQGDMPSATKTSIHTVHFVMAVKFTGCYGPDAAKRPDQSALSSESRPFIPQSMLNYFDNSIPVSVLQKSPLLPVSFQQAASLGAAFRCVPPQLERNYQAAVKNRSYNEFIRSFSLMRQLAPLPMETTDAVAHLHRLSLLTCLEECHMNISIKSYDIHCTEVEFTPKLPYNTNASTMECTMHIKGSQENRPKILLGERVRMRSLANPILQRPFEIVGVVKSFRLATEEAICEFPVPPRGPALELFKLNKLNKLRYQIRFTFDRCGFGYIQESIDVISQPHNVHLLKMLFPSDSILEPVYKPAAAVRPSFATIVTAPKQSSLNEQQLSVVSFLRDQARSMETLSKSTYTTNPPFVVFGPPGTGKTVTVVESIKQIVQTFPTVRVLACAPSDAAADVLCQRLSKFLATESLFRLNWWQRILESVPPDVLPYSLMNEEGIFALPQKHVLRQFQVIVATCGGAGALRHATTDGGGNNRDVAFDFVFIDEACQALEAEAMIPVSYCASRGQLVLAGDQFQLGPQPRSPIFSLTNSLQSLQERVLKYEKYAAVVPRHHEGREVSSAVTRTAHNGLQTPGVFLVHNYRSHKDIFEVSSKLFYGSSLVQAANPSQINSLVDLRNAYVVASSVDGASIELSEQESSVLFVGCRGKQLHDLDSPSYFNNVEIGRVVSICTFLLQWLEKSVSQRDIGVIAAYRSQVLKIRISLRKAGMGRINVGSVEDFQGREVRVVIVSTVISDQVHLLHEPGLLGLLGDTKRFNVAITRGMAATIVVGHPDVLRLDPAFRSFLDYCTRRGTCVGETWLSEDKLEDELEAESLLNSAASLALGSGCAENSFFGGGVDAMEMYYRDDIEWRTLL